MTAAGATSAGRWIEAIEEACSEPDPARCNRRITQLHYQLSEALAERLGRKGGPNFHSWAVWGSRKAGITIRQEDLESSIRNATITAGIVGGVVGAAIGMFCGHLLHWPPDSLTGAIGTCAGLLTGGWAGRLLAVWSRRRAAELILMGNRIVLKDIGEQTARFLELLERGATEDARAVFFAGMRPGATQQEGQDRLAVAFRCYLAALDSHDLETKRAQTIAGNCEIVYHEHIRLEPYIRGAMPFIIRRCATQRMMTYTVGERMLTVAEDVPGMSRRTRARNWARIEDRMRYIFALFRTFHSAPEVFAAPFAEMEIANSIERAKQAS